MGAPRFDLQDRLELRQQIMLPRQNGEPIYYGRYRCEHAGLGDLAPTERADRLMFVVALEPRRGSNLWCDERHVAQTHAEAGALKVLDLRHAWRAQLLEPFDTFNLFLPRGAFEAIEDDFGAAIEANLPDPSRPDAVDPALLHLARALLPTLERPDELDPLYAGHVIAAIQRRIALTYGGVSPSERPQRLAPWQERRVKARMLDDLQAAPTLRELAELCGLSESYFARAFKGATGAPPHQWLLIQRVDRAKQLLKDTDRPISDVAIACGFADQSHLTRVFARNVGATPAAWRRSHRY